MLRHRRKHRLGRILHDDDATELMDGPQPRGAVVEVAGEDHADRPGSEHLSGGPEQRIDCWPESMLARAFRHTHTARFEEKMPVGWRDIDVAILEPAQVA